MNDIDHHSLDTEDLSNAQDLAIRNPRATVRLFARDWVSVDRARSWLAAAGLSGRVSVHHRAARELLNRLGPSAGRSAADRPAA